MELQCPSSIMDTAVKLVYVVIKLKKKKAGRKNKAVHLQSKGVLPGAEWMHIQDRKRTCSSRFVSKKGYCSHRTQEDKWQ